jgi:hypothetical protein
MGCTWSPLANVEEVPADAVPNAAGVALEAVYALVIVKTPLE